MSESIVSCLVLTVACWLASRFLKRQVRRSGISISLWIVHSLLWSTQSKIWYSQQSRSRYLFFGILLLFIWSSRVGNLILVPLPFLNKLEYLEVLVHILLKPSLENFEYYFSSMWDECNCTVVWIFFGIAFLWDWNWRENNAKVMEPKQKSKKEKQNQKTTQMLMWLVMEVKSDAVKNNTA